MTIEATSNEALAAVAGGATRTCNAAEQAEVNAAGFQGAAVGAVAGAAIGGVMTGTPLGAAAGATLGGMAGTGVGEVRAQRQLGCRVLR